MEYRSKSAAVFHLLVVLCIGCGGAESYVKGQITLDGNVLPEATATFYPVAGGGSAYGTTDDQGNYHLKTGSLAGLASGEYRVVVVALEPIPKDWPRGQLPPIGKRVSPERYARPETTDLVVNITPGSNVIDLPLTSEPKS